MYRGVTPLCTCVYTPGGGGVDCTNNCWSQTFLALIVLLQLQYHDPNVAMVMVSTCEVIK